MKKRCIKCNKKQDASSFQKDINTKDGLSKKCNTCEGIASSNFLTIEQVYKTFTPQQLREKNFLLNQYYPDHQVLSSWDLYKQIAMITKWQSDGK